MYLLRSGLRHNAVQVMLILAAAIISTTGAAQTSPYVIDYLTEANGLLSNDASDVLVDHKGFCWIAHNTGLSQYDGRKFDTYRLPQSFIAPEAVMKFAETAGGQIIACNKMVLGLFTSETAHPFRLLARFPSFTNVYDVKAADDDIWVAANSGLWHYKKGEGLHAFPGIKEPVYAVITDGGGLTYAFGRLHAYVIGHTALIKELPLPTMEQAQKASTVDRKQGVWHISSKDKAYYLLHGNIYDSLAIPFDRKGVNNVRLFVSPYSGRLYYAHGNTWMYREGNGDWIKMPPLSSEVTAFAEDKGGNIWLATTDDGVRRIRLPHFGEYPLPTMTGRQTRSDELVVFNGHTQLPSSLRAAALYVSTFVTQDSSTWFVTSAGTYRQAKNGSLTTVAMNCRFICPTEKNCYWYMDSISRLTYCSPQGRLAYPTSCYAPWAYIRGIAADESGRVYVATEGALLVIENGRLRTLRSLPRNVWNRIVLTTTQGRLLINSGSTTYLLQPFADRDPVVVDSVQLSFRGKPIVPNNIALDYAGNLWVAAPGAVYLLVKDKSGHFNNNEKITLSNIGDNAPRLVFAGNEHKIYFSTKSQINYVIDVDTFLARHLNAPFYGPYLTNVQLAHQTPDWQAMHLPVDSDGVPARPVFTHRQNIFTFSFSAISPFYPEYILYQYRLDGFDTGWQPHNATGTADYTNLPPGDYAFRVRAADSREQWREATLWRFTILPPWWRTWWAWLLWWGSLAAGIVLLFQLRIRALRKRHAMERLVTEQQLKALRAQINPHFLQNTFDFLGRRVMLDTKEHLLDSLTQVSAYLRSVLYRSDKTLVTLEEEIGFIREFWAMQQTLQHHSFDYDISVDERVDTYGITLPALLLQPIAENAVKYGTGVRQNGGLLRLDVTEDDNYVYCRISDTGTDMPPPKNSSYISKGRQLTLDRMRLLYRRCRNKPYLNDERNATGGLTVTLAIPKK